MWRIGQIIVTEGGTDLQGSVLRRAQKSPWTHVFLVTGQDELVEADVFVGVRTYSMIARMRELAEGERSYVILEPALDIPSRLRIATNAKDFVGRGYNYLSALQWTLTGSLYSPIGTRLTCGELIARSCLGYGKPLFTMASVSGLPEKQQLKLLTNWATPTDILLYSTLPIHSTHLIPGRKYPLRSK